VVDAMNPSEWSSDGSSGRIEPPTPGSAGRPTLASTEGVHWDGGLGKHVVVAVLTAEAEILGRTASALGLPGRGTELVEWALDAAARDENVVWVGPFQGPR
jgi:hypothetical protein